MEWTRARIRMLRDVGLCQSQSDFAKTLGFTKRTIGNAERGAHPPSLALRRALDQALDNTSDIQRDRFLAAIAADQGTAGPTNVAIHQLSVQSRVGNAKKAARIAESIDTNALPAVLRGRRSQVHLEMAWATAEQADDALAVLHLLEAERVVEQAVSRNISARTLISTLLAREHRGDTPGLRGLAARAGLLP